MFEFMLSHGSEGCGLKLEDEWDREVKAKFTINGKEGEVSCFSVSDGNLGYTARCCGLGCLQKFSLRLAVSSSSLTDDDWKTIGKALADALSKKKLQYNGQKASQFIMSGQEGSFQNKLAQNMPGLVYSGPVTMNHRWSHRIQTFIWIPPWASKSEYTKTEASKLVVNE